MADLNWSMRMQISDGPSRLWQHSMSLEAYDVIEAVIEPGGDTAEAVPVQIQPGEAGHVCFLAIHSSLYDPKITFTANNAADDASESIPLLGPQIYSCGAVVLFGVAPMVLKFKNALPAADSAKKATIQVIVGRKATPDKA